ncbi:MAG TPA: molecular chaperone DnaJ [Actinomycetota bacterium]|nr:molecular chaperone DnaJ [Actinomycetota bacterium]
MAERDLYEVLGVTREASAEDIKRAYRRLAREYHPDVNRDPQAEHRFKEINLAYQTLSDPARRRQYDQFGGAGFTPEMFGFGDIGDIFEAFFGSPFARGTRTARRRTRARPGGDLHVVLDLTFEEAAFGARKDVDVQSLERCPRCEGNGAEPGTAPSRCATCGGSGELSDVRRSVFGTVMTSRTCPTCEGTGEEIASPCTRCGGEGRLPARQTVGVEVPAGVADGMELRVEGGGEGGRHGGYAGDLYLTLRVAPHPAFERSGSDLVTILELPVTTAMLGGEVEIETLDGPERITVPPGTRAGQVLTLRGRGVRNLGRRGRGNLLVRVDLAVPDRLSRKERQLVEQLAELHGDPPGRGPRPGRLRRPR